jgi:hypothetical protein
MHNYAVRRTAPQAFEAINVALSLNTATSSPVKVRLASRKTKVKANEIFPSPILS